MSAQVLTFQSRPKPTNQSGENVRLAEKVMITALCDYAEALSYAVSNDTLHPTDRAILVQFMKILEKPVPLKTSRHRPQARSG
jgi:hypothetical protein